MAADGLAFAFMTKTGVGVSVLGGHGFVIRKARVGVSLKMQRGHACHVWNSPSQGARSLTQQQPPSSKFPWSSPPSQPQQYTTASGCDCGRFSTQQRLVQ